MLRKYLCCCGPTISALILLFSCVSSDNTYNTVIKNTGSKIFRHSEITINHKKLTCGTVSPGNYAVRLKPSVQLPENVKISWQREDGKIHEKEIVTKGKLPTLKVNEEYFLIFKIDDSDMLQFEVLACSPSEDCVN